MWHPGPKDIRKLHAETLDEYESNLANSPFLDMNVAVQQKEVTQVRCLGVELDVINGYKLWQ